MWPFKKKKKDRLSNFYLHYCTYKTFDGKYGVGFTPHYAKKQDLDFIIRIYKDDEEKQPLLFETEQEAIEYARLDSQKQNYITTPNYI